MSSFDAAAGLRVYFDGGCKSHLGYCGAAVFGPDGGLLRANAVYLGHAADTHNKAEACGMVWGLKLGLDQEWETSWSGLTVLGDSDLIIVFM